MHSSTRSFLDLNPKLFGGGSSEKASMDHGAMLTNLGVVDHSSVFMLPGEVFGDLEKEPNKASVFAIGRVSVCVISASVLSNIGVKGLPKPHAGDKSDPICSRFLNVDLMRRQEESYRSSSDAQTKRLLQVHKMHQTELVWVGLCMHTPSSQFLVVKELNVLEANKHGMGQYVLREQVMLAQVGPSPFITSMAASWEEPERLFLTLELALLGDLRTLLFRTLDHPTGNNGRNPVKGELGGFSFPMCQHIAACAILGLKHLSEHQVIHRDLKPNNLVSMAPIFVCQN
jgi:serine/threonine protein kinase